MATTVNVGSSEFTITGTRTSGNFIDGPGWVVIPSGSDTLTAITPAKTTEGGAAVHGVMKNPLNKEDAPDGNSQGFDDRLVNSQYLASLDMDLPQSITAGDIIVKSISRLGVDVQDGTNQSRGLFSEYNVLYVLSSAPSADDFAPACYGWAGRGTPTPITLSTDIDTIVASLPAYDISGMDFPTAAEMVTYINHFDPAYGRGNGTVRSSGSAYEPSSVFKSGISNYGRDRAAAIGMVGLHLISNEATTAQKKTMMVALISLGIQWGYPWFAVDVEFGGNGAHHQFHQFPMSLAIKYAGLGSGYADILTYAPGNIFSDVFTIDQNWLDTNYVFHDSTSKPDPFRRHTIQTVNGNSITVNNPSSQTFQVNGLRLRRESDNARALITESQNGTDVDNVETIVIDAQPTQAFQVGDVVHFDFAADPQVGDVDWNIRTKQLETNERSFNPSYRASYRALQNYGDDLLLMKAFGTYVSDFDYVKQYVVGADTPNFPTATNDWQEHEEQYDGHKGYQDFRNAYWDDIFAGETPPGPDPEPEPPTPGNRPIIAGRTIILAASGLPLIG